jgi:TolA-binding protein
MKRRPRLFSAFVVFILLAVATVVPALALDEADRLYMVGEGAVNDGLHPLAVRVLERFVANYPSDARVPAATLLLGRAQLGAGQGETALETFRKAQRTGLPPEGALEARLWEGEALFRLKRYADARAAFEDVLRGDPKSRVAPDAVYGLAWTELESKRPDAAIKQFREVVATWPDHPLAGSASFYAARTLVEQKRYPDAAPILTEFATKYPNHPMVPEAQKLLALTRVGGGDTKATADDLYEAARTAGRLNRPKDQEAAWRRLRKEFPDHALGKRAALDLANVSFKRREYKDAGMLARIAATSEDETVRAESLLLAGESDLKLKRFAEAAKAFEGVTAVEGIDAGVRYRAVAGLGLAHEERQQWRPALTAYESVASKSPDAALRDWAQERAKVVKGRLATAPKGSNGKGPDSKPSGGKSSDAKPKGKS